MGLIFYLTRWPLPLGHNQDSSVSSVPCIFSHYPLQCSHIHVGQGPHHPYLQHGIPASAAFSLFVWNSLLSACPALSWRLRWSLASSILLPGGLSQRATSSLSPLAWGCSSTQPEPGPKLSCPAVWQLPGGHAGLSSCSYCFFLCLHSDQPSTGLRTSLLISWSCFVFGFSVDGKTFWKNLGCVGCCCPLVKARQKTPCWCLLQPHATGPKEEGAHCKRESSRCQAQGTLTTTALHTAPPAPSAPAAASASLWWSKQTVAAACSQMHKICTRLT